MRTLGITLVLRLALCTAIAYGLWRMLGPVGLAVSAPLFGLALAKPMLQLLAGLRDTAHARALRDVQGIHFSFRGTTIVVTEDENHQRWLRLRDLRKVLPTLPRDEVLAKRYRNGVVLHDAGGQAAIEGDTVLSHLAHVSEDHSIQFRHWLGRDVCRPAAELRRRLGIRVESIAQRDSP